MTSAATFATPHLASATLRRGFGDCSRPGARRFRCDDVERPQYQQTGACYYSMTGHSIPLSLQMGSRMKATSMEDPEQEDQIKGNGWLRKHDEPQFAGLGEYTAWIVGTKQSPSPGSAGVSCAGWFVRKNDDSELPVRHARTSDTSDSDEQRAGIAAVLRCLETLPRQANIRIFDSCRVDQRWDQRRHGTMAERRLEEDHQDEAQRLGNMGASHQNPQ